MKLSDRYMYVKAVRQVDVHVYESFQTGSDVKYTLAVFTLCSLGGWLHFTGV